jgi:type III restriction enzyme
METKDYQQAVLNDLSGYLTSLSQHNGQLAPAFNRYWQNKGVLNQVYKNNVTGVPHICVKVPTAGGKTFIAVCALERIFEAFSTYHPIAAKFVVWLVPSLTILEQTVKNLNNPEHPYRQKLNVQFNGRVQIYQKADVLQGAGFDADTVQGQLSIVVMSFDSLKGRSKEVLKAYQDNGYLASFIDEAQSEDLLPEYDKSALINVIRSLKPVLIVDESHNAESDLSVDMLKNLNPNFILDLTATPRNNSNIISYVDALALKKQNMVKLPVIVANQRAQEDVINAALKMRWQLEHFAKLEEKQGGKHIRPIVLFQAEPKNKDDTTTFDKIKATLISLGIAECEIKIKTANINELKGIDLTARDCPVRYIITINALKEGWDCPFAYILATLANKSSTVDVTQILGRVLRMPHVVKHKYDYLNMSYVFTASNKFSETLQSVVAGLNKAGFSERDYRYQDLSQIDTPVATPAPTQMPLVPTEQEIQTDEELINTALLDNDWQAKAQAALVNDPLIQPNSNSELSNQPDELAQIKQAALAENARYELASQAEVAACPPELEANMNTQKMLQQWIEATRNLSIPQFFISVKSGGLFDENETWQMLDKGELLLDFKLANQNNEIDFEAIDTEISKVDVYDTGDGDARASFTSLKSQEKKKFNELISRQSDAGKRHSLVHRLFNLLGKNAFYPIADQDVQAYITRIVHNMSSEQQQDCIENDFRYAKHIKTKIKALADSYAEKVFGQWLAMSKIECRPSFMLPLIITPSDTGKSIANSLYSRESDMNGLEEPVIRSIVDNCENLEWWHRNLERGEGFVINGFINHYPDFILMTQNKTLVLVEVKGADRDNSDSDLKMRLGKEWEAKANQLSHNTGFKYRYLMVFNDNAPDGAYTKAEAVKIIQML